MRPKRNLLNKLDLGVCLGVRVRKYRLDLGVGHPGLDRLRCASPERGERSEPRRDKARRDKARRDKARRVKARREEMLYVSTNAWAG
jgi:hypothetical protein